MLELHQVNFSYDANATLIDINLNVASGECVAVIGESGCGKSSLLNLIYGLLQEESGSITYDRQQLKGSNHHLVPGHPMMKYVPQEYDLMPYTTVYENVGEHISIQDDHRDETIKRLLATVDMEAFTTRKVVSLSGGQKQRVAIAKALAQQPKILLLDEPFSNIDHFRKNELRRKLFQYLNSKEISCIIATHDKDDVLPYCDRTVIMRSGEIIDDRTTELCYNFPLNRYCASLFDEVTEFPKSTFENSSKTLFFPHELQLSKTGIEVKVVKSYFKGTHYIIETVYKSQPVFFDHSIALETNKIVTINLNK